MWGRLLWAKILESKIRLIVMAWVAVDKDNTEYIYEDEPDRTEAGCWWSYLGGVVRIPNGSIKKLIGRELSWKDNCVELKEE